MKAVAVFPGKHLVEVIDHPEPQLASPTQAKVRMLDVGVCGTDREIISFEYGTPPDGFDYLILGHESLGEVVQTGPQVSKVKAGDLVVMTVRRPCHHPGCVACREGRQDFCYTGDFTERGIKQQHGYMTEFITEEEQYMNPVPRELRDVGVLVEPLTIAEKSLEQLWLIQQRLPWACPVDPGKLREHCHRAVVLGAGPVGLLGAMALRIAGFEVTVYSRSRTHEENNAIVDAIGARYVAAETHTVDQLAQTVGNIDVVYEAVGASGVAFDVIQHLGPNGVFIFTGVPGRHGPMQVDTDYIMKDVVLRNQVILGSVNAPPHSFRAAIGDLGTFVEKWPDAVRSLITARFSIEDALKPLSNDAGGIKNVISIAS
ncbi:MAG TPA: glucose 1-dehydrogenase [Bryobacteraceae bacterium]|nr:glucose 1-dehydrogenase [Bryobacteraceae bacterium]